MMVILTVSFYIILGSSDVVLVRSDMILVRFDHLMSYSAVSILLDSYKIFYWQVDVVYDNFISISIYREL